MNIIFILLLISLLAVEATQLWINIRMQSRNLRIYSNSEEQLIKQLKEVERSRDAWKDSYKILHATKTFPAFAISADGIKSLPEGWEAVLAEDQASRLECENE